MSGLGQHLRELLFGATPPEPPEAVKTEWRDAIHENKNVAQVSVGKAIESKKISTEALRVAECAIKIMEANGKRDGAGES